MNEVIVFRRTEEQGKKNQQLNHCINCIRCERSLCEFLYIRAYVWLSSKQNTKTHTNKILKCKPHFCYNYMLSNMSEPHICIRTYFWNLYLIFLSWFYLWDYDMQMGTIKYLSLLLSTNKMKNGNPNSRILHTPHHML